MSDLSNIKPPKNATGVIVLADGAVLWGRGIGAAGKTVGEVCFNTSMTGYQEILTDPSYAGQIITFTFPHIGNTGTNAQDMESARPAARGLIVREDITSPSNWRSNCHFNQWLVDNSLSGVSGIDTRALTRRIRDGGAPNGVICHAPDGKFDLPALHAEASSWAGLEGMDLAKEVSCKAPYEWVAPLSSLRKQGSGGMNEPDSGFRRNDRVFHIVAIDYGIKHNILRCLTAAGCRVTVVPCATPANDILALNPDGIFLSNGPGDPAATGQYAVPVIRDLLKSGKPLFGICLGHQMLALALGGKTKKMHLGHRGANHPVKDLLTSKVEITSQNHGFCVLPESLPESVEVTHTSLFDSSNEGLRIKNKPVFSVQYHPEASPGPQDSHYLFDLFVENIKKSG